MNIFVISLESEVVRRNSMRQQLGSLGLDYEFFDAIRGAEYFNDPRWYDDASARRLEGRSLRPGEVGCALSHAAVYAEIVKRGIPWALILEDDAVLHRALPALLSTIRKWRRNTGADYLLKSLRRIFAVDKKATMGRLQYRNALSCKRRGHWPISWLRDFAGCSQSNRQSECTCQVSRRQLGILPQLSEI